MTKEYSVFPHHGGIITDETNIKQTPLDCVKRIEALESEMKEAKEYLKDVKEALQNYFDFKHIDYRTRIKDTPKDSITLHIVDKKKFDYSYYCPACNKSGITEGDTHCKNCNRPIIWEGKE